MPVALETRQTKPLSQGVMYANVFRRPGHFGLEEKPIPRAGTGEAVIQVRLPRSVERTSISFVASIR